VCLYSQSFFTDEATSALEQHELRHDATNTVSRLPVSRVSPIILLIMLFPLAYLRLEGFRQVKMSQDILKTGTGESPGSQLSQSVFLLCNTQNEPPAPLFFSLTQASTASRIRGNFILCVQARSQPSSHHGTFLFSSSVGEVTYPGTSERAEDMTRGVLGSNLVTAPTWGDAIDVWTAYCIVVHQRTGPCHHSDPGRSLLWGVKGLHCTFTSKLVLCSIPGRLLTIYRKEAREAIVSGGLQGRLLICTEDSQLLYDFIHDEGNFASSE
jgi:hypothetical protein